MVIAAARPRFPPPRPPPYPSAGRPGSLKLPSIRGFALACLALSSLCPAPAQAKLRAVIVRWGEVEVGDPAGPLGPEYQEHSLNQGHQVTSSRFINNDDHIPAQLCRSFGLVAWLAGGPGDVLPDRIQLRVHHPVLTRPDGASRDEDALMLPVETGATETSFGFDDPWEVQPGDWTFDLMLDGEVAASKTFVLTKPAPGEHAPACPGRAVS